MWRRSILVASIPFLALLTGCVSGADGADGAGGASPGETRGPVAPETTDGAAQQQAQAWLDAAAVPPEAILMSESPGPFNSYQGWPCQPAVELEGYWTVPESTVAAAINWLRDNPTADLVSTAVGAPMAEDPMIDAAMVGYIPADGSQQGVVYTVVKREAGVAIRAEVAALTESAMCPSLGPGEMLGKPGQG